LGELALSFLHEHLGKGSTLPDATLVEVIDSMPESRLQEYPWIESEPEMRLRHSRGQSLPDWIALRAGRIGRFSDGVAFPSTDEDVRDILGKAAELGAAVIPYGGGTSVVGHINPLPGDQPVVTLDMGHIKQLIELDEQSLLARFGAGIRGPELEDELNQHGYLLGHYPQSFEYSTLGGWVATRSSGQQSYHYGRIEDLVAGGHLEMPCGSLDIKPVPASAAGPDLRHLVLGSEGRLGVITNVVVRISHLPQEESFHAAFFRDWSSGVQAVRHLAQSKVPLSMLRLSDPFETETTLSLAGREKLMKWADRGLRLLRYGSEKCLLLFGVTGERGFVSEVRRRTNSIIRSYRGFYIGTMIGANWQKGRFITPYLRNTLWDLGYAVDTLETAVTWSQVVQTRSAILDRLMGAGKEEGLRILAFAHLSHVYTDGASIYVTFLFPRSASPDETLEGWRAMKEEASKAIIEHRGTISHQHGVGIDHLPYLVHEKGEIGLSMLQDIQRYVDPDQIMNPGKLFPDGEVSNLDRMKDVGSGLA
jgi:alkyldihydroxyacetonephosphate synthase